jgi:hypothetical protein
MKIKFYDVSGIWKWIFYIAKSNVFKKTYYLTLLGFKFDIKI